VGSRRAVTISSATPTITLAAQASSAGRPDSGGLTFVGTATVLVRVAGFSFLTDPNFLHQGQHAKLGHGLRSRRLTEPALTIAELPALDFVLLSHHHGDHFDDVAAAELPRDIPIVTESHAARKLRRQGFRRPIELQTWQSQRFAKGAATLTITALPAKHAPQPVRQLLPPVMGSLIELAWDDTTLLRIYVTGDTLLHDGIGEIARRFPDIDLCVLHLGGTRIAGLLVTMDDRQGVEALRIIQPRAAVPVHYDDYTVFKSPLEDFRARVDEAALPTRIVYLDRGKTFRFPLRDD
jgi:L-ascorbate metabolism protein UlaG (beta-lactamase superfamily)